MGALIVSMILFGLFLLAIGQNPIEVYQSIYKGAFGSWFSWQNTLQRASPLMLVALCTALPARLGMIVIGGEGALVIGAVATVAAAVALEGAPSAAVTMLMLLAGAVAGGLWIGFVGGLRHYRGVNETISSLLLNYIAIAIMSHLVLGLIRDPAVLHRPSSWHVGEANMLGLIPGMDVHWGLIVGAIVCLVTFLLVRWTTVGFAGDIIGGNPRRRPHGRDRGRAPHRHDMLPRGRCGRPRQVPSKLRRCRGAQAALSSWATATRVSSSRSSPGRIRLR